MSASPHPSPWTRWLYTCGGAIPRVAAKRAYAALAQVDNDDVRGLRDEGLEVPTRTMLRGGSAGQQVREPPRPMVPPARESRSALLLPQVFDGDVASFECRLNVPEVQMKASELEALTM